jgi:hypothetical protein
MIEMMMYMGLARDVKKLRNTNDKLYMSNPSNDQE